ncbi:MAG: hypothetical protein PHE87_01945 [Victivallaceae bacterium]|nr:hypothetical protein [Victivallaceae bacterium]
MSVLKKLRRVDYIEIYAEMPSNSEPPIRRDITINFYQENIKILFIVIEAKSAKINKDEDVEKQLLEYFNPDYFHDDYSIPHLGIALTKWEEQLANPELISITWLEIISILRERLRDKQPPNGFIGDYYNFITKVDKGMNYYEQEVLSIPAGNSIDFIKEHNVHACPDKKGYQYKDAIFLTFRGRGGVMEKLYKIDKVIKLPPLSPSLENQIKDLDFKDRIQGYIADRKEKWKFESECKYRFYILSETNQINLEHKPAKTSCQGHVYFTLSQILDKTEGKL